ncbi:MAG: Response regulator of zinc sigma-54-dependent two-component system [Fibrobacteres bacterium]|nr:Response regulator of zinc sigma-54-dependent two-component system [Fibrobacterota bacterium]
MASFGIGAQLVWESGEHPPFPLNKVITTLGRNESNDIFLDDPKVSSFHGNILNREDGFHLLDLKSRNGTTVNGKAVSACSLQDGDAIAFGDIQLRFKSLTPFPKTPMPLARLNQKIHTMAIQSPGLREEAEEILREVERHQEFLKALVETVSALTESRTVAHFAEKLAEVLMRKLECRSVCLAAEKSQDLPKPCALETAPWEAAEAKAASAGGGRWLKVSPNTAGWRVQLAFQPAPERGWIAFLADGIHIEPKEEARDLLDMILLFASVLWRNLQEIENLHRKETGRLLEEKDRENRGQIEDLQRQNRELDDFLRQMRNQLVFAEGGPMEKVQSLARKLATVDLPVLITGETGTGKTYIAKLIHHFSSRAAKPFLVIDCATLPANLIESELFGHEKGAFTGAVARKSGKVETCAGGTLFLDEIGDLPLELQGKLLRFVQEGKFERLGGNETVHVDVRIVAATNYDLQERVKAQKFRQDLFYRLHVLPLLMPPLRDRADDIPALARHFIQKHFGQTAWTFAPDALDSIRGHSWPGNVRELENKLQRAWLFHSGNTITASDLGLDPGTPAPRHSSSEEGLEKKTLEEYREEYETALLRRCLKHYRGNITKCAEHLQISRNTCKSMLRKYKLVGDQDDADAADGAEG